MRQAQSEIPAYRQAGAFEMANFFMDDTKSQFLKPDPKSTVFYEGCVTF
jgi:hypothetical protein